MITAAGVLIAADSTGEVLLLLRKDGYWSTPGGHLERGESPGAAMLRELWEEVGSLSFTLCNDFVDIRSYRLFFGEVRRRFTPRLNDEHSDYLWCCPGDWPEPMFPGLRKALNVAFKLARV